MLSFRGTFWTGVFISGRLAIIRRDVGEEHRRLAYFFFLVTLFVIALIVLG